MVATYPVGLRFLLSSETFECSWETLKQAGHILNFKVPQSAFTIQKTHHILVLCSLAHYQHLLKFSSKNFIPF